MKFAQIVGRVLLGSVVGSLVSMPVLRGDLPSFPRLGAGLAPAQALQLADGSTRFVDLPRLLDTGSTQTDIYAYGARHYLTLALPEGATEALGTVVVEQREGSDRRWRYDLDRVHAFVHLDGDRRQLLALTPRFDRDRHSLTVTFDPPIPPGTTFTLALTPRRNPASEGIYLWGITAFPAGENPVGQFLGYGRFHFYRPDRRLWW